MADNKVRSRSAPLSTIVMASALALSACAQDGSPDLSATLAPPAETASTPKPEEGAKPPAAAAPSAAPRPQAAATQQISPELAESRRRRAAGDKAGALAVLDRASEKGAKDPAMQAERGLLALDLGQVKKAESILRPLVAGKTPDWRVHLGFGTALAAQGRQSEAQQQFAKALALAPENPAVLNNLALSYALDGKAADAERLLARVAAGKEHAARARQNLALLAGLGGRTEEAERHASVTMPVAEAKANVALLARKEGDAPVPAAVPAGAAAAAVEAPPPAKPRPERAASAPSWTDSVLRLGGPRE
jgi:Flp pilus assembly protein TadD